MVVRPGEGTGNKIVWDETMHKLRVYVEQLRSLTNLRDIVISGSEQRHIRANRLKPGDTIELFDRSGKEKQ